MRKTSDLQSTAIAEVQGLYGAFSFPEKLLQKIWLRGDFNRAKAVLTDGRPLQIIHPGKWNLLGGPDFTASRLRFDPCAGRESQVDVEVHLRAVDWDLHGHASDPAYDHVGLHVVLFPPEAGHVTRGAGGREIPVLSLLPLLHHALEEFAADEAVEALANRPLAGLADELGKLPTNELADLLHRYSRERWYQKVRFARLRIEQLGWEAACHHAALEILGYRFNRAPMLRIAGEWPLSAWRSGRVDGEALYLKEAEGWSLQGVRPANHPRHRLRQYAAWVHERPDWPARAAALGGNLPPLQLAAETPLVRREQRLGVLREQMADALCAGAIGGSRLNNFLCDGLLPLLSGCDGSDLIGWWYHWFCGDLPLWLAAGLRQLGFFDGRTHPSCHGAAQGLLGWALERESR